MYHLIHIFIALFSWITCQVSFHELYCHKKSDKTIIINHHYYIDQEKFNKINSSENSESKIIVHLEFKDIENK